MVRIKHRYLLVQILYPSTSRSSSKAPSTQAAAPKSGPQPTLLTPQISLHAPTPDTTTPQSLLRLVRAHIQTLYGDHGAGIANNGLSIKYFSNATSTLIVRCERAAFRMVWAALTFVRGLPVEGGGGRGRGGKMREATCVMQVLRVSGTIRKCEEEVIRRAKAMVGRVRGVEVAVEAGVGVGVGGNVEVSGDEDDAGAGDREGDVEMDDESEGEGGEV